MFQLSVFHLTCHSCHSVISSSGFLCVLVVISLEALKGYRSEEWMVIVVGEAGELTILGVDNILSLYLPFHSF